MRAALKNVGAGAGLRAAVNAPHSRRFAPLGDLGKSRQRLECGDFSTALSVADMRSVDDASTGGALLSAQIIKNDLGSGVSFHVRAPIEDGTHYFLRQNSYLDAVGSPMDLFSEPLALPVHYQP